MDYLQLFLVRVAFSICVRELRIKKNDTTKLVVVHIKFNSSLYFKIKSTICIQTQSAKVLVAIISALVDPKCVKQNCIFSYEKSFFLFSAPCLLRYKIENLLRIYLKGGKRR